MYYVVGCGVFCPLEQWSILKACYYITVTVTTVGYGKVAGRNDGRATTATTAPTAPTEPIAPTAPTAPISHPANRAPR